MITSNVADFIRLAKGVELHPGLIVLRAGHLTREEQWDWLEPAVLRFLATGDDLVNRAVVVTGKGRHTVRDLPPP